MPRGRPRKGAINELAALLVTSLKFLAAVPDKASEPLSLTIGAGRAYVNNGVLKAAIPIGGEFPEDIVFKLPVAAFSGALASVGKEMFFAVADGALQIKAGDFEALLNTTLPDQKDFLAPDALKFPLGNAFRTGVTLVGRLASDTGEELLTASIAVNGGSVVSTKRHSIMEYWHGFDMPVGEIFLPKAFAVALGKTEGMADVVGYGYSSDTFTVHFSNGAFLQTNTYKDAWAVPDREPNYLLGMAVQLTQDDAPVAIDRDVLVAHTKAIAAITDEKIVVRVGRISSYDGQVHIDESKFREGFAFDSARLMVLADAIKSLYLSHSAPPRLIFHGDNLRGCFMVDSINEIAIPEPDPAQVSPTWQQPPQAADGWGSQPARATVALPAETPPAVKSEGVDVAAADWGAAPAIKSLGEGALPLNPDPAGNYRDENNTLIDGATGEVLDEPEVDAGVSGDGPWPPTPAVEWTFGVDELY